jgi:lipopolysaccharide transport system permease protein
MLRAPEGIRVIEPRQAGLVGLVAEFWRFRRLIPYLGGRFLEKRFARTWLGLIWLPLRPLTTLATRILVFGGLVGISAGKTPYPIFFVVATAAWQLFYECAYWSTRSMELNRKLLTRTYVPKMVVLMSAAVPALVDFGINVCFAILGVLYYVVRAHIFYLEFGVQTLLVPVGLLLMMLLGLGIGFITSGAGARARDVRFGIGYALGFLYFLTPVIYPLSAVPLKWRPLAELNPLTGAVEMVKDGLFAAHELSPDAVGVTLFWLFLIWGPALWLFDRREVGILHGRTYRLPLPRLR